MIPETDITSRSRTKAARHCFKVTTENGRTFTLHGRGYTGTVERKTGGAIWVSCSCPTWTQRHYQRRRRATRMSCYHLPHFVEAFKRHEMLAQITTGSVIGYVVASDNECLPDRPYTGEVTEVVAQGAEFRVAGRIRTVRASCVVRLVRRAQSAQAAA